MRLVMLCLAAVCCAAPGRAQGLPGPSESQSSLPLTEREVIARVMSGSPRLRAITARIQEVRALQADRVLWPNPSGTYTRESAGNAHDTFVLATQELPITPRRGHLRTAGERAVEVAQAEARFEIVQLQSEVRDAYSQLALAQARDRDIRQSIEPLRQLIAMLQAREKDGEGSTYDRMRGERALIDLEAELAVAAASRVQAATRLAAFLPSPPTPESIVAADDLTVDPPQTTLATLVETALASRQDQRALQLSLAQFDAERAAANALKIPTPTITGGLKRSDVAGLVSTGYQVSLDLSVPLFNRGAAAVALAEAQRTSASAEADAMRSRIVSEVEAAYRLLAVHQARLARYREAASTVAEPLAKIGRVAYEEGEVGILELLDAERQALDARLRVLDFAAAVKRARIELDRVIGEELKP